MDFFRILILDSLFRPVGLTFAPLILLLTVQGDGTTPLHNAARANDLVAVQKLLRSGANPGAANRYGITPLSLAVENRNFEIVEALLKAGADPHVMLPGGQTLLMTAARTGNATIVKTLLERGADPNAR